MINKLKKLKKTKELKSFPTIVRPRKRPFSLDILVNFFRYTKSVKIQCIINHKKGVGLLDQAIASKECKLTSLELKNAFLQCDRPRDEEQRPDGRRSHPAARRRCFLPTSRQIGQTSLQKHRGISCNLRSRDKSFKL